MRNDHVTPLQMLAYVEDQLLEADRLQVERELTACDECLQLFIGLMESVENELPQPQPDFTLLEKRVVAQLIHEQEQLEHADGEDAGRKLQKNPARRMAWLQHPVAHYTIAASITLLLLASGTFTTFSQKLAQLDMNENIQTTLQPSSPAQGGRLSESWSSKIVDQTGSWLDGLKASRFK